MSYTLDSDTHDIYMVIHEIHIIICEHTWLTHDLHVMYTWYSRDWGGVGGVSFFYPNPGLGWGGYLNFDPTYGVGWVWVFLGFRVFWHSLKDTICVLIHLRESSTVYEIQQVAFNYFQVSAISAIFLAVCHAPTEFSETCRTEFYDALDPLKDFASHSYSSHHLWKSVRSFKNIAPRTGLSPTDSLPKMNNNLNQLHAVTTR